jgi:hypothetical protein
MQTLLSSPALQKFFSWFDIHLAFEDKKGFFPAGVFQWNFLRGFYKEWKK